MLCCALLCLLFLSVRGKYTKLGAVIHPADGNPPTFEEGREYLPTQTGQGSWTGADEPLGEFGWMVHPPIATSALIKGHDNVEALLCDEAKAAECKTEYEHCLLHEGRPHDLDVTCHCSEIYFSQCLFAAGCSTSRMHQCYDHLKKFNCSDTTLCGNNCVTQSNDEGADNSNAITIQVLNDGMNYLKISSCNLTMDEEAFEIYGVINEQKCDSKSFRRCPYWIPPLTLTSLTIDYDSSYLVVEHCIYRPGVSIRCLDSPQPREIRASSLRWPAVIEVHSTNYTYCDDDADCAGTSCRKINQPPHVCATTNFTADPSDSYPAQWARGEAFQGYTQGGIPRIVPEDWKFYLGPYHLDDWQSDEEDRK